eukprot:m.76021 g.76021  ORF g.76021 m.76021 type:complete len:503 (-) comp14419_c0_seq2:166-1674(-)
MMAEDNTERYPVKEEEYETLYQIGNGSTAKVFTMLIKATKAHVAVKKIDLEKMTIDLTDIQHELVVMTSYRHKNLVEYYQSFVVKSKLWIVLELMDCGSMLDVLQHKEATAPRGGILSEMVVATVLKGVVSGLNYLHSISILHRDIKAGNILLNRNGEVKLGDFGVSAFLGDSITAAMERGTTAAVSRRPKGASDTFTRSTFVGTPCWMAPEVLTQAGGYNKKADIWSLGITAIELATGVAPYASDSPLAVLMKIVDGPPPTLETVAVQRKQNYSGYKALSKFIKQCLNKDKSIRPSAAVLLDTALLKKAKDASFLKRELIATLPRDFVHHKDTADSPQGQGSRLKFVVSQWSFDEAELSYEIPSIPATDSTKEAGTPTEPSPITTDVDGLSPLPSLLARLYRLQLLLFTTNTGTPQWQEISFPVDTSKDNGVTIAEELLRCKLIPLEHALSVESAIDRILAFPNECDLTFDLRQPMIFEITQEGQVPLQHQGQVSIMMVED